MTCFGQQSRVTHLHLWTLTLSRPINQGEEGEKRGQGAGEQRRLLLCCRRLREFGHCTGRGGGRERPCMSLEVVQDARSRQYCVVYPRCGVKRQRVSCPQVAEPVREDESFRIEVGGGQMPVIPAEPVNPVKKLQGILAERGYNSNLQPALQTIGNRVPSAEQLGNYTTELVQTVRLRDMPALRGMAERGVDFGARNKFGEGICHLAARSGSLELLELVLASGGSLHSCDDFGKTPVHDACWTKEPHFDVLKLILDKDWRLLLATDVRGACPLAYVRQQDWHLWCQFLDDVKDIYWPVRDASGQPSCNRSVEAQAVLSEWEHPSNVSSNELIHKAATRVSGEMIPQVAARSVGV